MTMSNKSITDNRSKVIIINIKTRLLQFLLLFSRMHGFSPSAKAQKRRLTVKDRATQVKTAKTIPWHAEGEEINSSDPVSMAAAGKIGGI